MRWHEAGTYGQTTSIGHDENNKTVVYNPTKQTSLTGKQWQPALIFCLLTEPRRGGGES